MVFPEFRLFLQRPVFARGLNKPRCLPCSMLPLRTNPPRPPCIFRSLRHFFRCSKNNVPFDALAPFPPITSDRSRLNCSYWSDAELSTSGLHRGDRQPRRADLFTQRGNRGAFPSLYGIPFPPKPNKSMRRMVLRRRLQPRVHSFSSRHFRSPNSSEWAQLPLMSGLRPQDLSLCSPMNPWL